MEDKLFKDMNKYADIDYEGNKYPVWALLYEDKVRYVSTRELECRLLDGSTYIPKNATALDIDSQIAFYVDPGSDKLSDVMYEVFDI